MLKKSFFLLIALLLLYLLLWPNGVDPASWQPPPAPAYAGPYEQNTRLQEMELLFADQCEGCEDVAVDPAGRIYGGAVKGELQLLDPRDGSVNVLANTGGRPLGLDFDRNGRLIVADAYQGLLAVDLQSGETEELSKGLAGRNFGFTDDVEVGPDGRYYFSDASWKYGVGRYKLDLLEHRPYGSLFVYDPATKTTALLLDSLYFANGIAVSPDTAFVLVNETGKYRVTRYWLRGEKAGTADNFIDNLPGFPDGISRGENGLYWLTLLSPRNALLDRTLDKPFLRKIISRLPEFLKPKPERYNCILGLDAQGRVVFNLQDPAPRFAQISSVQQQGDMLYFGSLTEKGVGRMAVPVKE